MCGIIGQIRFNGQKLNPPLLSGIAHRGPDGNGEWINANGNIYLGHSRLAILEPTPAGYQPMIDASKRYAITFNGEIYNHLELRSLMPDKAWNGTSDTETLLELLVRKGISALSLLKGMFAFAFYNSFDESITLVRDRLGIKPLYIRRGDDFVSFASEVRCLVEDGDRLTDNALSEYIGFGRMPATGEILISVESILPGSAVNINSEGSIQTTNWWPQNKFTAPHLASKKDWAGRVHETVTKAVEEHLISDVGVGAFLSGGIDSSIVTLIAGKALGRQLKTFTVGFPQGDFDERSIARTIARQAGSLHFELEVTESECLAWVMQAVESLDLPSVDAINTYIVSKAVHDTGLKVALSGLGGDELFGGYPSFKNIPLLDWLGYFPNTISQKIVGLMPSGIKQKLEGIEYFSTHNLTVARRRFTAVNKLNGMGLGSVSAPALPTPEGLDLMGRISWAEIQGYMIPMLLRDSDQMSMAVGLEIRVPFLDHCLVEEVLSIPEKFKKGSGVKPLLVEAFKNELPAEVYNRPKQGFVLPMDDWMRGPLAQFTNKGIELAADVIGLNEPLLQRERFYSKQLHWTRAWKWCILGHWLARQRMSKKISQRQMQTQPA